MFIKFGDFRIARYKKGTTGFTASIYNGITKVGTAERENGKREVEDIVVRLNSNARVDVTELLKRRTKISIDGEIVLWSSKLMVLCLIENLTIYEEIKRALLRGNIVLKLDNEDFFQVLNIPNNPQNISMVRKNHNNIEMFGQDFINNYNISAKTKNL